MKIRNSFISNSSSSSFLVNRENISNKQLKKIHTVNSEQDINAWTIMETDEYISFSTWMNNFDMVGYLRSIGIEELENLEEN